MYLVIFVDTVLYFPQMTYSVHYTLSFTAVIHKFYRGGKNKVLSYFCSMFIDDFGLSFLRY